MFNVITFLNALVYTVFRGVIFSQEAGIQSIENLSFSEFFNESLYFILFIIGCVTSKNGEYALIYPIICLIRTTLL